MFHPVGGLAVELFDNGDVRHGCGRRGALPVLLARGKPDHVPWADLLNRSSPALCQSTASRHDQCLSQRMGVPGSPSARLERDTGAIRPGRIIWLEQGIDPYITSKPLGRSLAGGP